MLSGLAVAAPPGLAFQRAPAIITSDRMRPQTPSGLQIGDVVADRALVWSRADRPARLFVDRALREDFSDAMRVRGPVALESNDYVARVDLTGLPADRQVFVRVVFEDLATGRTTSAPLSARFRTAPVERRNVRFLWSADTAGQGFGINPDWGGMRTYETMRQTRPDFFIHCGDTIYADGPIAPAQTLSDGTVWKNLVTEEVSKVAETLREYRGRYAYNLLDEHVRRFSAEVPQIWQWDDHEVLNNWSDAKDLSLDRNYTEKNIRVLASRALQAFLDYAPMRLHGLDETERVYRRIAYGPLLDVFMLDERSYRGPNSHNRQERPGLDTAFLGAQQLEWLKQELRTSTALWKVVSSDMPIGLLVPDGRDGEQRDVFEAVANGNGPALGREFEFADLFAFIKQQRVRNVVWITGDVHYTAAHYYDPARAQFQNFDPFWEFVSGPLNAGTFGPSPLDNTFGPQVAFQRVAPTPNAAPSAGFQFFGQVDIDGRTGALTVTLKDVAGASLYVKELPPSAR
ncbi:MAG: alkaline phosphatase D family protein [Vicinamibacterales bacterium]